MAGATYRIIDEPAPSGLAKFAVNPVWPFFALMFAGAWLAYPWWILNGFATGSPARFKTIALVVAAVLGTGVLLAAYYYLAGNFVITTSNAPYVALVFPVFKIAMGYWLYITQSQSFEIYEYYGGLVKNGMPFVFIGYLLRRPLMDFLPPGVLQILAS